MDHDDFFDWLTVAVFDDEWTNCPEFFREVILRKLVRLGKVKFIDDEYVLPGPGELQDKPIISIVKPTE